MVQQHVLSCRSEPLAQVRRALRAGAPVLTFLARDPVVLLLDGAWPRGGEGDEVVGRGALIDVVRQHVGSDARDPSTCFQDLVGARALPGFDRARIRARLRFPERWVFDVVGLPVLRPVPLDDADRTVVVDAARAATGGDEPAARVLLAQAVDWSLAEVANLFGVAVRTARRWRARPVPHAARTLGLQLAIRALRP